MSKSSIKSYKFLTINIKSLDESVEKMVKKNLDLTPPYAFDNIKTDELKYIYNLILERFPANITDIFSIKIIKSIRSNIMREHMIYQHNIIKKNKNIIINKYNSNSNLNLLVIEYNASPLNLLRIIFEEKYKKKLTFIIKNINIINNIDRKQLNWAIQHDVYALINHDEIFSNSIEFENKIKYILDKHNIKYHTQNDLIIEQKKNSGFPTNTPDFLILDNFFINQIKINWIDAKNFYGYYSNYMIASIKKQTKKYIDKWGYGAIVFSLGFSSKLKFNNILIINFDSLNNK